MKINLLILTFILTISSLNSFRFKWPYALLGNKPENPRFMQLSNNKNKLLNQINTGESRYNMNITIIKETDALTDTPITFSTQCQLTKKSIKLYEKNKMKSEISFLE